jgi:deoxyadenosine/deoxycytidine kinase
VIGGNSVYQKERLNEILGTLLEVSEIHHVTLDADPEVIKQRILARNEALDDIKTPEWVDSHVRYMRDHYEAWTARIDNSALSPDETVKAIYHAVLCNKGRLTQRFTL